MNTHLKKLTLSVLALSVSGSLSIVHSETLDNEIMLEQEEDPTVQDSSVIYLDQEEAQYSDIERLASETGLTFREVEQSIIFQEAFGKFAADQFKKYPDKISAIWMEPVPQLKGHIRFVGQMPNQLQSELRAKGLDRKEVVLSGGDRISFHAQMARAQVAAEALMESGHDNFRTHFDPKDRKIHVRMQVLPYASRPNKSEIAELIQDRLMTVRGRTGENRFPNEHALKFEEIDLELEVNESNEPIVSFLHSRGGNWLVKNGSLNCTSGWSVSGPYGNGIITAAHCSGLNQYQEPGTTPYSMAWRTQHFGVYGDVEYHTTVHRELPEFNASSSFIRDVTGLKPTITMLGGSVCMYGRASNSRTCNHTVESIGGCSSMSGKLICSLARASNNSGIPGDSGGGWSFGTIAWGVTSGRNNSSNTSTFTPVDIGTAALGVRLLTR